MFSYGLRPLISKPSRLSNYKCTLIDNIFTNEMHVESKSGLLICDITDHLPIFAFCDYNVRHRNKELYVEKRDIKDCNVENFVNKLENTNWCDITKEDDVNKVYDGFINTVLKLYNECCPVKKVKI
jgi:hypothetical protein